MGGPSPPHRSAALNLILTHSGDFLRGHGEGVSGLYPCPRPSPPSAPIVTAEPGFQDHISVAVETTREQPFSGCGGGGQEETGGQEGDWPHRTTFWEACSYLWAGWDWGSNTCPQNVWRWGDFPVKAQQPLGLLRGLLGANEATVSSSGHTALQARKKTSQ